MSAKGEKKMAVGVVMPKAGISVESCIIGTWHKKLGDHINVGDILFDYETDKAAFECESTAEGVLLAVFFESGDEVPCLDVVCAVGAEGDDISGLGAQNEETANQPASVDKLQDVIIGATDEQPIVAMERNNLGAISPRARKLAERMKVDASVATPTGPRGRVIERDIFKIDRRDIKTDAIKPEIKPSAAPAVSEFVDEKMSQIRKVIAKSMTKSLSELAQLTNHHSCDATAMLNLRQRFKSSSEALGLSGISLNDMVLFAVAKTLLAHPDLNAHLLNDDTLRKFSGVHLGVAVDTPRGLMVPTIFNADKMSLLQLSAACKELAAQAKSGNISPDLLQGATFTVSNLGVLGVEMFTPVINPPQVAILGVCGTTAKVRENKIDKNNMNMYQNMGMYGHSGIELYQSMGLSLTYDHRAIDGAPASRFANDLAKNIENIDLLLAL